MSTNTEIDAYIERSEMWPEEISALRPLLLGAGLAEELKWGQPCYSHDGANVAIVQEMKDFLSLMFFKGALLSDSDRVLRDQGPNSRSARRIELTSVDDVARLASTITAYLSEAIDIENAGLEVGPAPEAAPVPELQARLEADDDLRASYEALTPGRRREYNLYFSGAKQAKTRQARVDRYVDKILAGKGLRDL